MQGSKHLGLILVCVVALFAASVAEAGVAIVVSAKSPITRLSNDQIADIFLGRSNRFPNGAQAIPIDQPETSSIRASFYSTIAGKSPAQIKAYWSRIIFTGRGQPPKVVANSADVKRLLASNPFTIGYIDARQVDPSVRVVDTVGF